MKAQPDAPSDHRKIEPMEFRAILQIYINKDRDNDAIKRKADIKASHRLCPFFGFSIKPFLFKVVVVFHQFHFFDFSFSTSSRIFLSSQSFPRKGKILNTAIP
jgi:hypothetical protein